MPRGVELIIIVRKIVNIDENLCNGCGQCIPKCAEGALKLVNGKARIASESFCDGLGACIGQCPQDAITIVEREAEEFNEEAVKNNLAKDDAPARQALNKPQWPLKINLVSRQAAFYDHANLLVMADCAPVAYSDFCKSLLLGKRILIGCPKFEDARGYAEKLKQILELNDVDSISVVHMEVPCCSGLRWAVDKALQSSGKQIPVKRYIITIGGKLIE